MGGVGVGCEVGQVAGVGRPWLGAKLPQLLVRQISAEDHSTPGKFAFHVDMRHSLDDQRSGLPDLVTKYADDPEQQLLPRCCFTIGAKNVTLLGDAAGHTLLTLTAPYASAGISMDVRARGVGPKMRMLHSGATDLPARLQLVFDWAVFSPRRWNGAMAAMMLEELLATPGFDPSSGPTAALVKELFAFVL